MIFLLLNHAPVSGYVVLCSDPRLLHYHCQTAGKAGKMSVSTASVVLCGKKWQPEQFNHGYVKYCASRNEG